MIADFLLVFVVTFLILAGVALALLLGRKPVYQPDEAHVQGVLTRMLEGSLPEVEWDFFIRMPIYTDEQLEALRHRCAEIAEQHAIRARQGKARLNEQGQFQLQKVLSGLEAEGKKSF